MIDAHLNIGSNLGDRHSQLQRAVALIRQRLDSQAKVSRTVESEPWGYVSPNRYVNIGVTVSTAMPPLDLLSALRAIEREIDPCPHRQADGSYADRAIDIDLIAYGEISLDTPELTLPHPRMHLRDFVLRPMAELQPGWVHPRLKHTPATMLEMLNNDVCKN